MSIMGSNQQAICVQTVRVAWETDGVLRTQHSIADDGARLLHKL